MARQVLEEGLDTEMRRRIRAVGPNRERHVAGRPLVGGPRDQMVSYYVAYYMNTIINFGQASALGGMLLIITMVLYWLYNRLIGIDKMKLG